MEAAGIFYIGYPSKCDRIKLWALADFHYGHSGCCKKKAREDIAKIATDPNSFAVLVGDIIDAIGIKDKRFNSREIDPTIKVKDLDNLGLVMAKMARTELKPIAHKTIGACYGNHEDVYMMRNEQSQLHAWLCAELGIKNLEYSALFDLMFVRVPELETPTLLSNYPTSDSAGNSKRVRVFVHHGVGAAASKSGRISSLSKMMDLTDATISYVGHLHDKIMCEKIELSANRTCTEIVEKKKIGLMTGSFLKSFSDGMTTYAEKKGYPPAVLGGVYATINPVTGDVDWQ